METKTVTLSEFLLARIGEDEAELGVLADGLRDESAGPNGVGWAEVGAINEVLMASHARMRAECTAKRRIVDLHELQVIGEPPWTSVGCCICDVSTLTGDVEGDGPCPTLRALALPYADHPDYQPEWRP